MRQNTYAVLLRGVNVGGKNTVPMVALRQCLNELGFTKVSTYIASGNIVLQSGKNATEIQSIIEQALPGTFKLDTKIVKALVLTLEEFQAVISNRPTGFGDQPQKYLSDVIFLMGVKSKEVTSAFDPREGVDTIWQGKGVLYSQRLNALRTKSRLNRAMSSPYYQFMTIRNWNTTKKLAEMMSQTATS